MITAYLHDRRRKATMATPSVLSQLRIEASATAIEYDNVGYITRRNDESRAHGSIYAGIYCGNRYVRFPEEMGGAWPILKPHQRMQLYETDYGYIICEQSRESILLEVLDADCRASVFKILKRAGWNPEIVGERKFIRCQNGNVQFTKNRYT